VRQLRGAGSQAVEPLSAKRRTTVRVTRDNSDMRLAKVVVVGALAIAGTARATPTPFTGDQQAIHGFVWEGEESLDGRVTDAAGRGVSGAQVHIVDGSGEHVLTTDHDGRYHLALAHRASALVFVYGDVHITSAAARSNPADGGETVDIHELAVPATPPKLKRRPKRPEYSDAATDHNAWLRAWLLLEIDETGSVARVKLLDHPGYDLDPIAVRNAFTLEFEPARDHANRPVRTDVLWAIDWPAYWWLVDHGNNVLAPIPYDAWDLPCHVGQGPPKLDRSCAPATIANALTAPWIERPRAGRR